MGTKRVLLDVMLGVRLVDERETEKLVELSPLAGRMA